VRRRLARDVVLYVRGKINIGLSRAVNAIRRSPRVTPPPVDEVIQGGRTPLALSRLLEGRSNKERQAALSRYLGEHRIPFALQAFTASDGVGENFSVDVGSGERVLVLVAHHDAVPGSPGANDNAAAVGILLNLLERLSVSPPTHVRVRFLFTAEEERGYLGARHYVREANLEELAGVLSLELCGIGDSVALWDAAEETPFLGRVRAALEGIGLVCDATYHVVGRIPLFGSDHRAFAPEGVPAYGFTLVPTREAEALRQFVFSPLRSAFRHLIHRPVPFDTYHSPRDAGATLEPAAMALAVRALEAIIAEVT
jgi:Zn-dependent M28 family amino/carboxypeptidase